MAEKIRVGDQRTIQFELTNTPVAGSSTVFDLTSYTVTLHKTNSKTKNTSSITNADSQLTVTDATGGKVQLAPGSTYWNAAGSFDLLIEASLSGNSFFFPATGSMEFVVESKL